MFHGSVPLGASLHTVLTEIYDWLGLAEHASETIIASIKEDADPVGSTKTFATAVAEEIGMNATRWYLTGDSPDLGTVRGKLVLIRRYGAQDSTPIGIDLSQTWPNSAKFTFTNAAGVFTIQDNYTPDGSTYDQVVASKWTAVSSQLTAAATGKSADWYLNFASAVAPSLLLNGEPVDFAIGVWDWWVFKQGINIRVRENLYGKTRYGMIMMDFPEQPAVDLTAAIVACNFS
jgi:1-phosphatidylinositol phosphodiesterase